ncbi:hypothetical protein DL96DRAFT_1629553 [Flagelloscypha sp. PMI_526]|nr:hypothetical protein DL96DRAFT_1629553 [Flagelloscypha sp. PMI_526]
MRSFPLLTLCSMTYDSILPILYHCLIINTETYARKSEIFRQHRNAFSTHCRAFRVNLASPASADPINYVWKVLLPSLPRVTHFESFFGYWDPYYEHSGSEYDSHTTALTAISTLPLSHLRLDWHFNSSGVLKAPPSPSDYPSFFTVKFLQIVVQGLMEPSPELFCWFPSLTHLQLILSLDAEVSTIARYCLDVIGHLLSLRVLLIHHDLDTEHVFNFDPRIVEVSDEVKDDDCFLRVVQGTRYSLWRNAERIRDTQKSPIVERDGKNLH